jgi:hypothetical protein
MPQVGSRTEENYFLFNDTSGPCRKLNLLKPKSTRRVGKPELRWLDSVEEDLKDMDVRYWRRKSQDREQWRTIFEEVKVDQEL